MKNEIAKIIIIFLDIDGVVFYNPMDGTVQNRVKESFQGREHELELSYSNYECTKAAVDLFSVKALESLNRLIQSIKKECKVDIGIVLSSAWRERKSLQELKELFRQHSFSEYLIDKTPEDGGSRGEQITRWLNSSSDKYKVVSFVILDDDQGDLLAKFPAQLVLCNHRRLLGHDEYEKAQMILLKQLNKEVARSTKKVKTVVLKTKKVTKTRKTIPSAKKPSKQRKTKKTTRKS
ncbi:MAG: hypothetical protein HQK51_14655 [Oligoflexia bacterium]|nr:hypothetical protein [Oligoflexia bacterium]